MKNDFFMKNDSGRRMKESQHKSYRSRDGEDEIITTYTSFQKLLASSTKMSRIHECITKKISPEVA